MSTSALQRVVLWVSSLALFMEAVDTTILNTAIPSISHSLAVSPIDLKIALISYLLSLSIFIPISGWAADKFGLKCVFISALIIFTVSSIGCGFVNNLWELVMGRTLQGIGGALTVPVARLLIVRTFEKHQLIYASNRIVIIASFGTMLGPVLGGLISGHYSWRWIFWANAPVGLFLILVSFYKLEKSAPRDVHPLDIVGFLLFGIGLAGVTFGLSAFSESALSAAKCMLIIIVALIALLLYALHSRDREHPIVNPLLFRFRTFQTSIFGNLLTRLGFGGLPFLLPLMLQIALGYSPQLAGLILAPTAIGTLVSRLFNQSVIKILGFKKSSTLNTLLVSLSLASFAFINQHTSLYLIAILTFIFGVLISLQNSSMTIIAYADIPNENLNDATSIVSTAQQLAQSFGVAISAMLLLYFSGPSRHGSLNVVVFKDTFLVTAFITAVTTLVFLRLKKKDGEKMIHRA